MENAKKNIPGSASFDFDATLPYTDADVKEIIGRLVEERLFLRLLRSYRVEEVSGPSEELPLHIKTVDDFQEKICVPMACNILGATSESFTFSGMENIDKSKGYLFISNHRDIILDSALLNVWFLKNGFQSTQMAIGNNLYFTPWLGDFFRMNKGLMIRRDLKGKQFFYYSKALSDYIHDNIQKNSSIWIAQREGRTKDGYDRTQIGLLKMLFIGQKGSLMERLRELRIVPTTISYEYEPCDNHKVKSLLDAETGNAIEKNPRDDLYNMLSGLGEKKGRIHIHVGKPITHLPNSHQSESSGKDFFGRLAKQLEIEIHANFQLRSINYIAYDLLFEKNKFADKYDREEKEAFMEYMNGRLSKIEDNKPLAKKLFLQIYANPLVALEDDAKTKQF